MASGSTNGSGAPQLAHHRGGSGEPLVLIHGIGHTWRGWKPMLPELERRFDVLSVDLPGHGHSEPLPAGTESTPEALADAVERQMLGAGFDSAHLAGNSLGGWISFELAGPSIARPWRCDPELLIEAIQLYTSCPGLYASLPHTFHGQPRGLTTLDV